MPNLIVNFANTRCNFISGVNSIVIIDVRAGDFSDLEKEGNSETVANALEAAGLPTVFFDIRSQTPAFPSPNRTLARMYFRSKEEALVEYQRVINHFALDESCVITLDKTVHDFGIIDDAVDEILAEAREKLGASEES